MRLLSYADGLGLDGQPWSNGDGVRELLPRELARAVGDRLQTIISDGCKITHRTTYNILASIDGRGGRLEGCTSADPGVRAATVKQKGDYASYELRVPRPFALTYMW